MYYNILVTRQSCGFIHLEEKCNEVGSKKSHYKTIHLKSSLLSFRALLDLSVPFFFRQLLSVSNHSTFSKPLLTPCLGVQRVCKKVALFFSIVCAMARVADLLAVASTSPLPINSKLPCREMHWALIEAIESLRHTCPSSWPSPPAQTSPPGSCPSLARPSASETREVAKESQAGEQVGWPPRKPQTPATSPFRS